MELVQNSDEYITESEYDSEDVPTNYTKSTLDAYYPNFDKYNIRLDNIVYPIFRKTVVGTKCMICKRNPDVTSIENHHALESHKFKITDRLAQNKLKRFHDFWMQCDNSIQIHQKYFHRMKCVPCDVQVEYESLLAHIISVDHATNISKFDFALVEVGENSRSNKDDGCDVPISETRNDVANQILNNSQRSGNEQVAGIVDTKSNQSSKPVITSRKSPGAHVCIKAVTHPESPNILDRMPFRYKDHTSLLIIDNMNNIFCSCCSKKLKNDMSHIKEHIDSPSHLKKSNVPKKKMKYFCEICIKRYSLESSWDNHLMDLTHMARFNNLSKSRRDNIIEHECLSCETVVFGDEISLRRHETLFANKRKPKEIALPRAVFQLFTNRKHIIETAEKLLMEANQASENQEKEKECCIALVRVMKEVYPSCKAFPFGSRVTGLGYCDSDLDVFLDIGDMYNGLQKQDQIEQSNIVNTVAKTLQKHKALFGDINKVALARTPIVQVYHKESKVDCDVSFRHGLSVENTAFIRLCIDLQPILRPTILLLKEWYAASHLNGLSSYALTMLGIFYLQTNGYLLSVKELRLINPESNQLIDGWETIRYTASLTTMKQYINNCQYTVFALIENFFEYYAKLDFEKWVICPLMGMLIHKIHFNGSGVSLPQEMGRYVAKLYGPTAEYFRNATAMCVQDPFDLSHNLTKACGRESVRKFQIYCNLSKKHLSALT